MSLYWLALSPNTNIDLAEQRIKLSFSLYSLGRTSLFI
jgi:hypothetical protein